MAISTQPITTLACFCWLLSDPRWGPSIYPRTRFERLGPICLQLCCTLPGTVGIEQCFFLGASHAFGWPTNKWTNSRIQDAHTWTSVHRPPWQTTCPLCFCKLLVNQPLTPAWINRIHCIVLLQKCSAVSPPLFFPPILCVHISFLHTNACNHSTHCISVPSLSPLNISTGLQSLQPASIEINNNSSVTTSI